MHLEAMRLVAIGLILAWNIPGIAATRFDTNVDLVVVSNRFDSEPMAKEGQTNVCTVIVPFSRSAEEVLPKDLQGLFTSVRLVPAAEVSNQNLTVSFEVVRATHTYYGNKTNTLAADFELRIAAKDAPPLRKRFSAATQYVGQSGWSCEAGYAAAVGVVQQAFVESIHNAVATLSKDGEFLAFVESFLDGDASDATLMAGLTPLTATYRVTEDSSVIRKKPMAKGQVVKKIGLGSQLQIIGKLPTGWLQVAKEGEAIGWIHEGSVAAMSVQQPAVAAVAAPPSARPAQAQAPVAPAPAAEAFPTRPVAVSFKPARLNPDDVAVIIGNANYKATAKDIPDVVPAYADAEGMKRYAIQALGIKEENVIFIKDAKLIDLVSTFGTADDPKGKLFNWVKPQASNVFVFYSGHGAPSADGASSYLVPVDAQAALINLSGYSLKTLYGNLGKLPAKSVTVVLEACFSGASQSGMLVKNASPIYQKAMAEMVPANLTVISAGSGNQIASWEQDKSHGLFTKHYLLGMAGAADRKPYGNGDGKVTTEELQAYLKGTMSYFAQRYYGREQVAQIMFGQEH